MQCRLNKEGEKLLRKYYSSKEVSALKDVLERVGDVDEETCVQINSWLNYCVTDRANSRKEFQDNALFVLSLFGAVAGLTFAGL